MCAIAKARYLIDKLLESTIEASSKRNAAEEMHNTKRQRSANKQSMYLWVNNGTGYMYILQRRRLSGG